MKQPPDDGHPEFSFTPPREEIRFPIDDEVIITYPDLMTKWELVTLNVIREHEGPIHQSEIIRIEKWMGCHPKYEKGIGIPNTDASTKRRARGLIRDLRLKYSCPIPSSNKGYWIATTKKELAEYVIDLEKQAKAQAASFLRSYTSMDSLIRRLNIKRSDYFDQQEFDDDNPNDNPDNDSW